MNKKFDFVIPKDKRDCQYIGFDFKQDKSSFIFPCQYLDDSQLSENEREKICKKESKKIITLLKRVQQDYLFGGSNKELSQFYSMIWLLQDYIDHGYYVETETLSSNIANGKINWKKTLKQNSILFNNNNIIYKDFVRDRKVVNDSQTLTQIYKSCLAYSAEKIGFIFGISKTEPSIFDIQSKDKTFINYYLTNQLKSTFRDYKKTLLNHLLSIINNQNSQNKSTGFSIFDSEFEYVFEFLINKVFGTENVKEFYNTYSYFLPDKIPTSKLRPDTIVKDQKSKTYYILDSKYYNYGYSNNPKDLPSSSSISKQIGYTHYLKDNLEIDEQGFKVKSIFVLPYSSNDNDKYIKYVGYAQRNEDKKEDDKILVLLIDLKQLIDCYLKTSKSLSSKILIEFVSQINI